MANRKTVLVVKDEFLIRLEVVNQLEDAGYRVFPASNADEAILAVEPSITLLFTDIDMPVTMDGLKLAAVVRNRWPQVKIIVTSGRRVVEMGDLHEGKMFFSKPYSHVATLQSTCELLSS